LAEAAPGTQTGAGAAGETHPSIHGGTTVVGIIGWPVERSLSPAIHNAAFAFAGLEWIDVPMPVEPGRVPEAIEGLRALGFAGANVTMPHKTEAARLLDLISDDAARLQAVNTIVVEPDGSYGHNTDAPGFERFLRMDAGIDAAGTRAVIFGAGGAARAVALALARAGASRVTVAARAPERSRAIVELVIEEGTEADAVTLDAAASVEAELIVNATPLGRDGERLPLPPLGPATVGVDLLYPDVTPLQEAVVAAGGRGFGGLGLLLHQAALSFELWTGREAPLEAMRAAAEATIAGASGDHAG
jgi:shikimate dehydrogenase